jgi:hypothetical protein
MARAAGEAHARVIHALFTNINDSIGLQLEGLPKEFAMSGDTTNLPPPVAESQNHVGQVDRFLDLPPRPHSLAAT